MFRDANFFRLLPKELDRSRSDNGRIKVMGFPPLGIQTLAPVLRRLGYLVQMFDTCHPEMQAEHIAQAGAKERPDVIALSFLSTTTYPTVKNLAKRLKLNTPHIPIIVGGAFATMNADRTPGNTNNGRVQFDTGDLRLWPLTSNEASSGTGAKTKKKLRPGVQVLPGEWALAYARNRYTEGGDFDRAARQQQVIMGIREQILRVDMLPNLISKAPALYNELASSIRTNLTLDEVISLALLAQSVPDGGIKRGIIDKDNVFFGNSPDGLSILIPIPDDIQNVRDESFATGGSIGPQVPGSAQEQMKAEAARLAVYDGSSDPNLGGRAVEYLRSQGANVIQTGAADRAYSGTRIVDHTGNPYLVSYLVELLQIAPAPRSIRPACSPRGSTTSTPRSRRPRASSRSPTRAAASAAWTPSPGASDRRARTSSTRSRLWRSAGSPGCASSRWFRPRCPAAATSRSTS